MWKIHVHQHQAGSRGRVAFRQAPGASAKTYRRVSLGDDEQPRSKSGHGDVPMEMYRKYVNWLVVWNMFLFSISYMGCDPSHWWTPLFFKISYFSRWLLHHQPVKVCQSWVLNFRNVGLTMTKKLGWTIKHGCLTWVDQQIVQTERPMWMSKRTCLCWWKIGTNIDLFFNPKLSILGISAERDILMAIYPLVN